MHASRLDHPPEAAPGFTLPLPEDPPCARSSSHLGHDGHVSNRTELPPAAAASEPAEHVTSGPAVRIRMTGQQRKSQLVGIGRALFAARGLDGTTIEEIAAAAGVSKPVIYEHFGSKEGLYRQVVDTEFRILLDSITEALSTEAKPRVLVERAALALLGYIEDRTDGFRILVRDAPALTARGRLLHAAHPRDGQGGTPSLRRIRAARIQRRRRSHVCADARGNGGHDRPVVAGQPHSR